MPPSAQCAPYPKQPPAAQHSSAKTCVRETNATSVAALALTYLHGREDLDGLAIDIQIFLISCTSSALVSHSWAGQLDRQRFVPVAMIVFTTSSITQPLDESIAVIAKEVPAGGLAC